MSTHHTMFSSQSPNDPLRLHLMLQSRPSCGPSFKRQRYTYGWSLLLWTLLTVSGETSLSNDVSLRKKYLLKDFLQKGWYLTEGIPRFTEESPYHLHTGPWFWSDEKGNLIYQCFYLRGLLTWKNALKENKPHGAGFSYYEDGALKEQRSYRDGHLHGDVHVYYSNGNLKEQRSYRHGQIEGKVLGYYFHGIVEYQMHYRGGKKDGTWIWYDEKGSIEALEVYENGVKVSVPPSTVLTATFFPSTNGATLKDVYQDGVLRWKQSYKSGALQGQWLEYDSNGVLRQSGQYQSNLREGDWYDYFPNGNVKTRKFYFQDEPANSWSHYDQEGLLIEQWIFNQRILRKEWYDSRSEVYKKASYDSKKTPNVLLWEATFKNNQIHGERLEYWSNRPLTF